MAVVSGVVDCPEMEKRSSVKGGTEISGVGCRTTTVLQIYITLLVILLKNHYHRRLCTLNAA